MSEGCIVRGCIYPRDGNGLACRRHWVMVPGEVRQELSRLARQAPGTPRHIQAWREITRLLMQMAPVDGGRPA